MTWYLALALALFAAPGVLAAQQPAGGAASDQEVAAELKATEDAAANKPADAAKPAGTDGAALDAPAIPESDQNKMNILEMLVSGGWCMIPIGFMLVLTVTFVIERILGLRRLKVMPEGLTTEFGRLAVGAGGFDPRKAYRICQEYPCTASNVIRSMLLKIGRPHAEVEHAVNESKEREAARMYANVRWLNLSAAISPLLGLYGTVWGMILSFHATATMPEGANKGMVIAAGIAVALVTTLGGLFVAIPAAIAAHFFEGRIQTLFHEIDDLLYGLLPQIERFEGKLRVSRDQLAAGVPGGEAPPIAGELIGEKPEKPSSSTARGSTKSPDPVAPPVQQPAKA